MVKLTINGIEVQVKEGTTILDAAKKVNVHIPTLCHLDLGELGYVNKEANCRVCMVEIMNWGTLAPACVTKVAEGMDVRTDTIRVVKSRKTNIELLLSDHPKDCLVCRKNGNCELQDLAMLSNISEIRFKGEENKFEVDNSSLSIIRDPNKCILCKRCITMCNEVQTVGTLTDIGRGFSTVVGTAYHDPMFETNCTFCGQCLAVCPTGALSIVSNVEQTYEAINNPDKVVVVQTAPAVRVALGEEFGMEAGSVVTGKMVTALKQLGFDYVFDTDFAADLTTIEEATEFISRFKSGENLPIITSCCPSWVKFVEHNFPEYLDSPSSCKSPHEMFGSVTKSYFAEKMGIDPKDIVVVSVMPCVSKKYESARPELASDGEISDVDIVITTVELATMIKDFSIDFKNLNDSDFDELMGESTGAGVIFGSTGGVAESTIRTAHYMLTGEEPAQLEYNEIKELKGIKETSLEIDGATINIAVAGGLGNVRKLMDMMKEGKKNYHIIEIMACPGGCIDGGGQPSHHGDTEKLEKRKEGLRKEDRDKELRCSYENPSIQKLYKEYLGEPGSEKAHELLHTSYKARERF